jgi:hypothetical protein
MRRGDNIPTVADYAHYNEEAEAVWYAENRHDMEHADEEMDDGSEDRERGDRYDPDPFEESFVSYEDALAFLDQWHLKPDCDGVNLSDWGDKWYVDHYDEKAHKAQLRKRQ